MVIYRKAQADDRRALEQCFCELQDFERTIEPNRADSRAICGDYIDGLFAQCGQHQGEIFVAEVDEKTIGFICVLGKVQSDDIIEADREYAYVTDLYVVREQRGGGIGEQLLAAAEAHALNCGAGRLRVGVLAANPAAYRFYRQNGFRESEIVLEKRLAPPDGTP